jgi:hypothetical protein
VTTAKQLANNRQTTVRQAVAVTIDDHATRHSLKADA